MSGEKKGLTFHLHLAELKKRANSSEDAFRKNGYFDLN